MAETKKFINPVSLNLRKAVLADVQMQMTIEYNEPKTTDNHRIMYQQSEMLARFMREGTRLTHSSFGNIVFRVTKVTRKYYPPKLTVLFKEV